MKAISNKSQKVREYFIKHPLAVPKEVGAKFKCAMPVVYKIRKESMHEAQEALSTELLGTQITDAVTQFTPSNRADDLQVGGDHYKNMLVQPWKAMQSWLTPEQFAGFLRGNAIKYLARCDVKGGIDDVKKARHYIDKLIEVSDD